MELTSEQEHLASIFQPRLLERILSGLKRERPIRFVHYTNAQAAMNIIEQQKIWMRKSSCMNDYMEVQHGLDCLHSAYRKSQFRVLLEELFEGLSKEIEDLFNGWTPALLSDTYLTCLSEHMDHEDKYGRLSMWRAYCNSTGVALVFNGTQVLDPVSDDDIDGVYAIPVDYYDGEKFETQFSATAERIKENIESLRVHGYETVKNCVFQMLKFMALSTKHPGFEEEKEWRVIYCPQLEGSPEVKKVTKAVNGDPQPICEIPLKNIAVLLDRVIIGPSEYASATKEAFVDLLTKAGIPDADKKVIVSNIPLRR